MKTKNIIIIAIVLASIIVFTACEKIIEIDIEATAPRIVCNAAINPDTAIQVHVTRSMHILDSHPMVNLTNAEVDIYEDNQFMGSLQHWRNGIFKGDYYPQSGKTYKVIVKSEGLPDVEAECIVPNAPNLIRVDTTSGMDEYGQTTLKYSVRFDDPSGERNYYHLFAMLKYTYMEYNYDAFVVDTLYQTQDTIIVDTTWGIETPVEMFEQMYIYSEDIIITENLSQNYGVIFSDELIDGQEYAINFNSYIWFATEEPVVLYFYLHEITEELYKYYNSYEKHISAKDDPFAEPVMVYSNVKDGFGIFGASCQDVDSIVIEHPADYQMGGGVMW